MRVLSVRMVLTLFVSFFLQLPSQAQEVNPGTESGLPPYGSFHGSDFDQINLQNGNLHLEIPMFSVKQRGKTFTWRFLYDSPEWKNFWVPMPTPTNPHDGYYSTTEANALGWRVVGPFDWGISPGDYEELVCPTTNLTYQLYANWTVMDPSGTLHQLPLRQETGNACAGQTLSGPALDGSGITYNAQTNIITLKDGTQFKPTGLEDTNGNKGKEGRDGQN
jgi:hypothetical protein